MIRVKIGEKLSGKGVTKVKKQILFIHSAGAQGPNQGSSNLAAHLQITLGTEYKMSHPRMPKPENPEYALWKLQLEKELAALDDEIIVIGHSLGGSILMKYLSEEICKKYISGLFLVAAPYWGKDKDWRSDEFTFRENFTSKLPQIPRMFIYHSRNDEIVPLAHLGHYTEKLPQATARVLDGNEHAFNNGLPILVDDIKGL